MLHITQHTYILYYIIYILYKHYYTKRFVYCTLLTRTFHVSHTLKSPDDRSDTFAGNCTRIFYSRKKHFDDVSSTEENITESRVLREIKGTENRGRWMKLEERGNFFHWRMKGAEENWSRAAWFSGSIIGPCAAYRYRIGSLRFLSGPVLRIFFPSKCQIASTMGNYTRS